MGYEATNKITLTFNGSMPKKAYILRPNQNGLPACDVFDWMGYPDNTPGNQYLGVDDIVRDNDLTYDYTDRVAHLISPDATAFQYFSKPLCALPAGATVESINFAAFYKYHLYDDRVAFDKTTSPGFWIPPANPFQTGNGGGYISLKWTVDDCSNVTSSPSVSLAPSMWGSYETYPFLHYNLNNNYRYLSLSYLTNPSTGLPWTEGEIDTIQFGFSGINGEHLSTVTVTDDFFFGIDSITANWTKDGWCPIAGQPMVCPNYYDYIGESCSGCLCPGQDTDDSYVRTKTLNAPITFGFDATEFDAYKVGWIDCSPNGAFTLSMDVAGSTAFGYPNTCEFDVLWIHNGTTYVIGHHHYTGGIGSPAGVGWQTFTDTIIEQPWDNQPITSWDVFDSTHPNHNTFGIRFITNQHPTYWLYLGRFRMTELTVESQVGELRVTSENLQIVYTESPPSSCQLPSPSDVQVNQSINTKELNFWSGNRDVYALGRSSKRTNLSGIMWDGCTDGTTTCEDLILCVRTLGKMKQPITIGGLKFTDLNKNYNMLTFSWLQVQEKPNKYEWELELEFCD